MGNTVGSRKQSRSDAVIHVLRPADGSLLVDIEADSPARVVAVGAALRQAQPEWEQLGIRGRTRHLVALRDWLLDNESHILDLMQAEAGKVRAEAALELNWVLDIINTYAASAPRLLSDHSVRPHLALLAGKKFTVARRPYPLVGVIGPWNFPLVLCLGDGLPALFAGAAVLLKPSEYTPVAAREIVRAWNEEIGAPPVLDIVIGAGETGSALVDTVDFVQFTGSARTGHLVGERAMKTLTPCSLELGGKDPFIVLADSNLTRAANCAVVGGFGNNGQVCIATERVYVESSVYEEFVDMVVARVKALKQGVDGPQIGADVGAMTTAAQIDIVAAHVEDAVAKGATVLTGGKRVDRPGNWYEPTVLVDVDHSMKVMVEETFGPVLPIMRVADEAEAVRQANDTEFGLAATVFSGDVKRAERVARLIDAGTVNVNDYGIATMCIDVPMGGWKQSGLGSSRSGDHGLLKYTREKSISSPRLPTLDGEPWWFPYTPSKQRVVAAALRLSHARGLRRLGMSRGH